MKAKHIDLISDICRKLENDWTILREISKQCQENIDNYPENMQSSDRFEIMENELRDLDEITSEFYDIQHKLYDLTEQQ